MTHAHPCRVPAARVGNAKAAIQTWRNTPLLAFARAWESHAASHRTPAGMTWDVLLEHLLSFLWKKLFEACPAFSSDAADRGENSRKGNNSSCRCMRVNKIIWELSVAV